ncbi:MAG: hypothetical protein K9J37_11525 [Saprospiraceae bacterium]|nr:hypothetical protein [Saprospiraceae bacterium]MCF8250536.1 hypothetical protein [Saprospiraceae bacterium]MCF8279676.1 hypothetical protein [Bacteroidales bacterium]MCF8312462.1 hypothetical protein [Saprospiraceae bacterium]MCF8440721.1 hypothetical protein [Saprospiraceae bacterium]
MDLEFDEKGFLSPYGVISADFGLFEETFVSGVLGSTARKPIFENYQRYNADLRQEILPNFRQWVNGSFVTKKLNPRDIDIVTFIPFEVYEKLKKEIEAKFTMKGAEKNYGVDAYTIKAYPANHKYYEATRSDMAYWQQQFSKTKFNRAQKRYPKGFIELIF